MKEYRRIFRRYAIDDSLAQLWICLKVRLAFIVKFLPRQEPRRVIGVKTPLVLVDDIFDRTAGLSQL